MSGPVRSLSQAMVTPTGSGVSRVLGDLLTSVSHGAMASVLALGQSNVLMGRDSLGVDDPTDSRCQIQDQVTLAFTPLVKGNGGIGSTSGQHALFNFTKGLLDQGHSQVRVVMNAHSGRPWSEWVGTPADRTVSVGNRPWMDQLVVQCAALDPSLLPFRYVWIGHGEANYADVTKDYIYERIFFMRDLIERGYADGNTVWLHPEGVDDPTTRLLTWHANRLVNAIPYYSTDILRQVVVSSAGLIGLDEGSHLSSPGNPEDNRLYTIHFSSEECSEMGRRMAAAIPQARGQIVARYPLQEIISPLGRIGSHIGRLNVSGAATPAFDLSADYLNGTMVDLLDGDCTITIKDLTGGIFGNGLAAGPHFFINVSANSTLTLVSERELDFNDLYWATGVRSNMVFRNTTTRTLTAHIWLDGTRYVIDYGTDKRLGSGDGQRWYMLDGYVHVRGSNVPSVALGATLAITFTASMPVLANASYTVNCGGACTISAITTTGFTMTRNYAVDSASRAVSWDVVASVAMS